MPDLERSGLRLLVREEESAGDMWRAVFRAVETWARVMFLPSRGLGGVVRDEVERWEGEQTDSLGLREHLGLDMDLDLLCCLGCTHVNCL